MIALVTQVEVTHAMLQK